MGRTTVWIVCFFSLLAGGNVFADLSFQALGLPADLFPAQSDDYAVESVRESVENPGFLHFTVQSPHAVYEIEGLVSLRQRLREIQVIEFLDRQNKGLGIARGAADSITDTGRGLANFVIHPIRSTVGLGRAVGKLGGKVTDVFRKKEPGEKSSFKENLIGSEKRQIAKKLGVDVYSPNLRLQSELDSMAKLRMGGKGAVAVVKFFIPVGIIASAVMTASNLNDGADKLVNDTDRADLFEMNKEALAALGVAPDVISDFLNDSDYTPREATYIRFYLEGLKSVWGNQQIIRAALQAKSVTARAKILHEAEIAANYAYSNPGVTRLHVYPEGVALEKSDALIFIAGYDYLDDSVVGNQVADKAAQVGNLFEKDRVELWNAGLLTPVFEEKLASLGINGQALVLFRRGGLNPDRSSSNEDEEEGNGKD